MSILSFLIYIYIYSNIPLTATKEPTPPTPPSFCAVGSQFEGEKCITSASTEADYVNDGCDINGISISPPRFGTIESGVPVCGQFSKSTSEGFLDRDIFRFTVTSRLTPIITVPPGTGGFRYRIVGVTPGTLCPLREEFGGFRTQIGGGGVDNVRWSQQLLPGDYAFVFEPIAETELCGSGQERYELTVKYQFDQTGCVNEYPCPATDNCPGCEADERCTIETSSDSRFSFCVNKVPTPPLCSGDSVFENELCVTSSALDVNAGCYTDGGIGIGLTPNGFNPKPIRIGDERSCGQLSRYTLDGVATPTGDLDTYQLTVETAGLYSFILESDNLRSGPEGPLRIAPYVFGPDPECTDEPDPVTGFKITNYISADEIVGDEFIDDTTLAFIGDLNPGFYQIIITAANGDFNQVPECDSGAGLGYFLQIKDGADIPQPPPSPTPPPPVPVGTPGFPPVGGVCEDINNQDDCNGDKRDEGPCVWLRNPPGRADYCSTRASLKCYNIGRDQCNPVETLGFCEFSESGNVCQVLNFPFGCGAYGQDYEGCNLDERCAVIRFPFSDIPSCRDLSTLTCSQLSVQQCSLLANCKACRIAGVGAFTCNEANLCNI